MTKDMLSMSIPFDHMYKQYEIKKNIQIQIHSNTQFCRCNLAHFWKSQNEPQISYMCSTFLDIQKSFKMSLLSSVICYNRVLGNSIITMALRAQSTTF